MEGMTSNRVENGTGRMSNEEISKINFQNIFKNVTYSNIMRSAGYSNNGKYADKNYGQLFTLTNSKSRNFI